MKTEIHPTHTKTTRFVMIALILLAGIAFTIGFYYQEKVDDQFLVDVFVAIYMFLGLLLMLVFVARAHICRCPECKSWLRNKGKLGVGDNRLFICKKCNVCWDSQVRMYYGGE